MIASRIDVLTVFLGRVVIEGWLHTDRPVRQLELRGPGLAGGGRPLRSYGKIPSPDVAEQYGSGASHVRYAESLAIDEEALDFEKLRLVVRFEDGTTTACTSSCADRTGPEVLGDFLERSPRGPKARCWRSARVPARGSPGAS